MSTAFTDLPPRAPASGKPIRSASLVVTKAAAHQGLPFGGHAHSNGAQARFSALDWIFAEQQDLTAVDRFARQHAAEGLPANARFYRDLIPARTPGVNQQYAFEVDLDVCTGCKACVTGCHNLNGLDDGETWRTVGLLHGGTAQAPAQQTVTTACHHCADPACLSGCPVKAYEKDPVTGIVKHLDDQCIGCQYCVLMCPYDAPKYNPARGIVRKCDMCSDRLANAEAPACVQSCPNQAIRIAVVERADVVAAAVADHFLPGAPSPAATQPSTVYKNGTAGTRGALVAADLHHPPVQAAHPPLVVMLTLTQLSVGALMMSLLMGTLFAASGGRALSLANASFAATFGGLAMAVMPLHLGRPRYAFRALLGLRTSWLSREILAFSVFMGLFSALMGSYFLPGVSASQRVAVAFATALAGALGVACSVMVYAATRRAHWRLSATAMKFALSSLILGCAAVQVVSVIMTGTWRPGTGTGAPPFVTGGSFALLSGLLVASVVAKLIGEFVVARSSRAVAVAPSAAEHLETVRRGRLWFAFIGGVVLPVAGLAVAGIATVAPSGAFPHPVLMVAATGSFLSCLAGELCERYLFFAAAPASKMPGARA